jgi:hypothetical protein
MNDLVTLSPDAQPSFGSTRHFGSVSEPRPPNGCSPWVRPSLRDFRRELPPLRAKCGSLSASTSALTLPKVVSGLCLMPS